MAVAQEAEQVSANQNVGSSIPGISESSNVRKHSSTDEEVLV